MIDISKIDLIIGIDPGLSGAISTFKNGVIEVMNMPRKLQDLNSYFINLKANYPICFLERVQLFDTDNKGKQFRIQKMLQQYSELKTVIKLCGIRLIEVAPITWQTKLKLRIKGEEKKARKDRYKKISQEQNPNLKVTLKNSDALQILRFGRIMLANDLDWINKHIQNHEN